MDHSITILSEKEKAILESYMPSAAWRKYDYNGKNHNNGRKTFQ